MGKASRRRRTSDRSSTATVRTEPAPFVRRPFEGLPGETEWVALREILPAATALARLTGAGGIEDLERLPEEATVATVLPMAWPGLHRADGGVVIGTQSGASSGDASRDLAANLLATAALEPGTPLTRSPAVDAASPRLQDLLDPSAPLEVSVHDTFDFWVEGAELEDDARASLDRANESIVPTTRLSGATTAFWVRIGERAFVRHVLGDEEDAATDALARLHGDGEDTLGEGTRLLGAFRACGLLVPVWEIDPEAEPESQDEPLSAWTTRYAAALASDAPLTAEQRRARSGLLSRQVTLR